MPEILKGLKEQALDKLSVTGGKEMDLTANFNSGGQIRAILELQAHECLGSKYVKERKELLERLTCSYNGTHRSNIVDIGKTGMMNNDFGALE